MHGLQSERCWCITLAQQSHINSYSDNKVEPDDYLAQLACLAGCRETILTPHSVMSLLQDTDRSVR